MGAIDRQIRSGMQRLPLVRSVTYLVRKPLWPGSVPRPSAVSALGSSYDTQWAREPLARIIRALMVEGITRPVMRAIGAPVVTGSDRLARLQSPVIFAANHSSHLDTSVVLTCIPARFRHRSFVAAGADYFFDKRWKARLWALWLNIIPIEREKVGRKSANLAARLIDEGWNLVIFPEGTRGTDDFAGPFRGGAAYLAIRCRVPVVPVHIEGTRRIFAPGSHRLKPGSTRVTFGEPLYAEEGETPRKFNARLEHAVAFAADEANTDWWSARCRSASGETPLLRAPVGVSGWRKNWLGAPRRAQQPTNRWPR